MLSRAMLQNSAAIRRAGQSTERQVLDRVSISARTRSMVETLYRPSHRALGRDWNEEVTRHLSRVCDGLPGNAGRNWNPWPGKFSAGRRRRINAHTMSQRPSTLDRNVGKHD